MSTGESYDPEKWNTTAGKPINTISEDSKALIAYLETIKRKIFEAFQDLNGRGAVFFHLGGRDRLFVLALGHGLLSL